jgi:hypothetical protein
VAQDLNRMPWIRPDAVYQCSKDGIHRRIISRLVTAVIGYAELLGEHAGIRGSDAPRNMTRTPISLRIS